MSKPIWIIVFFLTLLCVAVIILVYILSQPGFISTASEIKVPVANNGSQINVMLDKEQADSEIGEIVDPNEEIPEEFRPVDPEVEQQPQVPAERQVPEGLPQDSLDPKAMVL